MKKGQGLFRSIQNKLSPVSTEGLVREQRLMSDEQRLMIRTKIIECREPIINTASRGNIGEAGRLKMQLDEGQEMENLVVNRPKL